VVEGNSWETSNLTTYNLDDASLHSLELPPQYTLGQDWVPQFILGHPHLTVAIGRRIESVRMDGATKPVRGLMRSEQSLRSIKSRKRTHITWINLDFQLEPWNKLESLAIQHSVRIIRLIQVVKNGFRSLSAFARTKLFFRRLEYSKGRMFFRIGSQKMSLTNGSFQPIRRAGQVIFMDWSGWNASSNPQRG
jgi:hypothetical protein